jgi:hypothetical protein
MSIRRRGNKLERWEIALAKAMVVDGRWPNDQDVLAHFTRPTRSINHRAISEIRTGAKHGAVKAASSEDLNSFLATWPAVDAETGLSLHGDELLIKAREAMIAAVHTFNSAGLTFRAELFIVTAIIAWTYLLHAWFKREGIDYRHTRNVNGQKAVALTPSGKPPSSRLMRRSFTVVGLRMRSGSHARGPTSHLLMISAGGSRGLTAMGIGFAVPPC